MTDPLLPIMLRGPSVRALVVGGGPVGLRRARSLVEAGADVRLVAPSVDGELPSAVEVLRERFASHHVEGRNLVVAATDVTAVNEDVQAACVARGVLCCRADDAAAGEVVFPAVRRRGPVTAAVVAGSPSVARQLAETAVDRADFAAAVATLRPLVFEATTDPTDRRLAMTDAASPAAADAFATDGVDGLRLYLAQQHPWLRPALTETW